MSPSVGWGIDVSIFSTRCWALMYPFTLYLSFTMKETTVIGLPPTRACESDGFAASAARTNPCGVKATAPPPHAEFSPVTAAPVVSVYSGCCPPPRGGFSNWLRVNSSRETPFSKSMVRVYFAQNCGYGPSGGQLWGQL